MNICQRYVSKSLIYCFILFFLIVFLLESNFGFQFLFNITNYLFFGLKIEKIIGNWRDFTLKNITYDSIDISAKAASIHILIDPMSLFSKYKIFNKIETKNLIFLLNKNSWFIFNQKNLKKNILNTRNIFINNIILKNIYSDQILFKFNDINIKLLNIYSKLQFFNNNFNIFYAYINSITMNFTKSNKQYFLNQVNYINQKQINNFVSYFLQHKKFLFPININIQSIICKKINFFHQEFKNVLFRGKINNQCTFTLKLNDFIKCNIHGKILLNNVNHPMYMNVYINRIIYPIKKNFILSTKNINLIIQGKVNNYYLLFNNIINISGAPSVVVKILGQGNLNNIALNKIYFTPLRKNIKNNKLFHLKYKNYIKYISKLIGNINISHYSNKGVNNIYIPNFNIKSDIMHKNLFISGSLYYNSENYIKIPTINFFSGKNKGFISGSISHLININSSINANNLDYFIPNVTGVITATLDVYGLYYEPILYSKILGKKFNWNNIVYFNNIKMLIHIDSKKHMFNNIDLNIKTIKLLKFSLDYLKLKIHWNKKNQQFDFFLKNPNFTINFIINGTINDKKKTWIGIFKKINIFIDNKKWIQYNNPIFFYDNHHITTNKIKYKNSIFSILTPVKNFLFSSIFNSYLNFHANVFFHTKFVSKNKKHLSYIKTFLHSKNIILQKKIKNQIFTKRLFFLKLYMNFKQNNLNTKWLVYPFKTKYNKLFGFLNIYDYLHQKKIQGKYFLFNFPCSILNFFMSNTTKLRGFSIGHIMLLGTLYQPDILADINLHNVYFTSNKILKYITLFFYPSFDLIKYIKINQSILIQRGKIFFQLNSKFHNDFNLTKWNILFHSNHVVFFIFPQIKLNLFSQFNLCYFLSQYNLNGYLRSYFFNFKINEKNFIF